jgi:hypothetical protein
MFDLSEESIMIENIIICFISGMCGILLGFLLTNTLENLINKAYKNAYDKEIKRCPLEQK